MQDLIYFFLTSLLIMMSTLGYGYLFIKIVNFKVEKLNLGLVGFLGLFFLSIIASYSHIFMAHSYLHNIIIIFLGLIFLYFFSRNFKLKISFNLKLLILIFLFLFIS